jgi:uncharacterized protein GlcG (DUF336 family)
MRFLSSIFVACSMLAATAVSAQAPASVPDKMPFDIPYGQSIGVDLAKKLLMAAEAEAKKHGWKFNIAVDDTNGELVLFERMDGAQIGSVNIAQGKARTAARYRRETRVWFDAYEKGHPYVSTLDPTIVASPGGFPLVENGKVIGAIGCSGGTGAQDAVACKAGADLMK